MRILKINTLLATLLAGAFNLLTIEASPYTISDDRIRSLDITPVLGRGYSIGTNSFQSTCLVVDEVTSPSYNYDYTFTDVQRGNELEQSMEGSMSASFSYWIVKGEVSVSASSSGKYTSQSRMIVATMRIERYYSSVREELSPLSDDALTLLDRQDYIGFFKSCGPNYIRSIRRAQELTAIFSFTSSSAEMASEFSLSISASTPDTFFSSGGSSKLDVSASSKFSSIAKSMQITIVGFGLGLNSEGSSTMVAASLEEYQEVMKYGFKSFTQNEDSHNIGMVYGMEIVPWVDNTAFQVNSKLMEEAIIIPLSRSLIPVAFPKEVPDPENIVPFENTEARRKEFKCKDPAYHMDRYGYCCESSVLWSTSDQKYKEELKNISESAMNCRPARQLDKSVVKNNMSNNGEFVAHLDAIVRYKLNQIFTLEKCLTTLKAFPIKYDYHILKNQDTVKYDLAIARRFTVKEMRFSLDPLNNYSMLKHLGQELDEFVEMYYQPCVAEIFGMNIGSNPDTEPQYFMAYAWLSHSACLKLSCLADNMRWDRDNGGCISSLLVGKNSPEYGTGNWENEEYSPHCKKDNTKGDKEYEICKYKESDFTDLQTKANECWKGDDTVSVANPAYFMNYYCMPSITGARATKAEKARIEDLSATCPGAPGSEYSDLL